MRDSVKKIVKVFVLVDVLAVVAALLVKRLVPEHGDASSERFRIVCVTDGKRWSNTSGALRMGSVITVMGGVELDLTGADLAVDGAQLELITIMGGVEVTVPDDWTVRMEGVAVMGGNEAPRGRDTADPDLTIHCTTVMGGVEVKQIARPGPVTQLRSGE